MDPATEVRHSKPSELLDIQSQLLERLARGIPLEDFLNDLCAAIETLVPNAICSVMRLDKLQGALFVCAGPSVGESLCQLLDGLIPAENAASCGTAAYTGTAVLVEDTATDPRWADYRAVAEEFGIGACWSIPIICDEKEVVGTFGISHRQPTKASPEHLAILDTAASLAGIAMSRAKAEENKRQIELKIQQAQKLESLGVLAGGIAHDFNNLLTSALGNTDLAQGALDPNSPARLYLARVDVAIQRMAELSRQMLAYSGGASFIVRRLSISNLVHEMGDLLKSSISKNAIMRFELPSMDTEVMGDATQLRQVIMNLITNASDAIASEPGEITLRIDRTLASKGDLSQAVFGEDLSEGEYVCFEVSDSGSGMTPQTREKMFDPFFTTKQEGHGLGLAATLGIVRGHGGCIKIETATGEGTSIRVMLPAHSDSRSSSKSHDGDSRTTVLVVDDEEYIRALARDCLETEGYHVHTAVDGADAVREFKLYRDRIELVILDLTMPNMSGIEVLEEIVKIAKVPVVLSSGYSKAQATEELGILEIADFLQKPYRAQELVEKVKTLLDSTQRSTP